MFFTRSYVFVSSCYGFAKLRVGKYVVKFSSYTGLPYGGRCVDIASSNLISEVQNTFIGSSNDLKFHRKFKFIGTSTFHRKFKKGQDTMYTPTILV